MPRTSANKVLTGQHQNHQDQPKETAALERIWKEDSSVLVPTKPPIRMVRLCLCAALFYGFMAIMNSLEVLPPDQQPKEPVVLRSLEITNDSSASIARKQTPASTPERKPEALHASGIPSKTLGSTETKQPREKLKICMVVSVAEDDALAGPLRSPVVDSFRGIPSAEYRQLAQKNNFRFFLVTDIAPEKRPKGWTVLQQPLLENSSIETLERYVQYLPQKHKTLAKECNVVFFTSYLESVIPRAPSSVFLKLAERIRQSTHGLALHRFEGHTIQSLADYIIQKDPSDREELERTIEFFQAEQSLLAPAFNTTFMGMDLDNPFLLNASQSFWKLYQPEVYSVYDSLIWSHVVEKHGLKPLTDFESLGILFNLKEGRVVSGGNRAGRLVTPLSEAQLNKKSPKATNARLAATKHVHNGATPRRRRRRRRKATR